MCPGCFEFFVRDGRTTTGTSLNDHRMTVPDQLLDTCRSDRDAVLLLFDF